MLCSFAFGIYHGSGMIHILPLYVLITSTPLIWQENEEKYLCQKNSWLRHLKWSIHVTRTELVKRFPFFHIPLFFICLNSEDRGRFFIWKSKYLHMLCSFALELWHWNDSDSPNTQKSMPSDMTRNVCGRIFVSEESLITQLKISNTFDECWTNDFHFSYSFFGMFCSSRLYNTKWWHL